jgi:hypothetical protein
MPLETTALDYWTLQSFGDDIQNVKPNINSLHLPSFIACRPLPFHND